MLVCIGFLCVTQGILERTDLQRPSYWILVGGCGFWLALFLYCRAAKRSNIELIASELACALGWVASTGIAARLLMIDQFAGTYVADEVVLGDLGILWEKSGAVVGALFIGVAFTIRAATVPTGPLHTTGLTLAAGLLYTAPWMIGPPFFDMPIYHLPGHESESVILTPVVVPLVLCWSMTAIACHVISRVVHGLQKDVRDARELGQYTLEEKLGEGGMGEVYRARHNRLRRPTAIKLLPTGRSSELAVTRFEAEVQLTAELTHPNTITIFDYGRTDDGVFYYAMEYLAGVTLEEVVTIDGPQPATRVIKILEDAAGALQEAHAAGLIHRDIKPANIMLTRQGNDPDTVKVLDFGLVKPIERQDDVALTTEGMLVGTPQYLAPETITAANTAGPLSDIYSLGAVGYFLLTGTHVFSGANLVEMCAHHLHTAVEPVADRLGRPVAEDLEALVLQCLAKLPAERPDGAAAMIERLRRCEDHGGWTSDDAEAWWEHTRCELHDLRAGDPTTSAASENKTITVVAQ